MKYIFGKELTKSEGPHLQGYVEWETSFRPIEKLALSFDVNAWFKAKGNKQSNIVYCSEKRASREVSSRASWWVVQVKSRSAFRHDSRAVELHHNAHSKTALQQRSDTRFLRGLCAPLAHLCLAAYVS